MLDTQRLFRDLVRIEVSRSFPTQTRGRPRLLNFDHAYDGMLRVLRTGMQWRELTSPIVSHITIFKTMQRWIDASVFHTAYRRLLTLYHRRRSPKHYSIDSSFVKNVYGHDCTGRNPTDRGRRATKLSVLVDDLGIPVSFLTTTAHPGPFVSVMRSHSYSLPLFSPTKCPSAFVKPITCRPRRTLSPM